MQVPLSEQNKPHTASSLLAYLHEIFQHHVDKSVGIDQTSIITLSNSIPEHFIEKVYLHAFKQSEDELILLLPTLKSSFSLLNSALSNFPQLDLRVLQVFTILHPFLTNLTSNNLNNLNHNGIAFQISLNSLGEIIKVKLLLNENVVDFNCLFNTSELSRNFDVFYHLLYSQELNQTFNDLELDEVQNYDLLKNGRAKLPKSVTFADDYTLAKDWLDAVDAVLPTKFKHAMMCALSGILKMGNHKSNFADFADGAALVGLDAELAGKFTPNELICATYKSLIFSLQTALNKFLASLYPSSADIASVVTIAELGHSLEHKKFVLKGVFDNDFALNAEMVQNGLELPKTPPNVTKQLMKLMSVKPPMDTNRITDVKVLLDKRAANWYLDLEFLDDFNLEELMLSSRLWNVLSCSCSENAIDVVDNDKWSSNLVSMQIRDMFVTEWAARSRVCNYTADYDNVDFVNTFRSILPPDPTSLVVAQWAQERYPPNMFFQGFNRVYLGEQAWMELESIQSSHLVQEQQRNTFYEPSLQVPPPLNANDVPAQVSQALKESSFLNNDEDRFEDENEIDENGHHDGDDSEDEELMKNYKTLEEGQHIEVHKQTRTRKAWVVFVYMLTFWIPSPLLQYIGGMTRRDVRMAWREKVTIFFLITLFNAGIIFYMIVLGKLICPDYDKVWNHKELAYHQGTNDFYVGIHGQVYDITKFYSLQHSDNGIRTSSSVMMPVAGLDISDYFPPPLTLACPSLVSDSSFGLVYNTTRSPYHEMLHASGPDLVPQNTTQLHELSWYRQIFMPKIDQYYKGRIVETQKDILKLVNEDSSRYLVTISKVVYDMSNYIQTINQYPKDLSTYYEKYNFFPDSVTNLFINYQGLDITEQFNNLDEKTRMNSLECMHNMFVYAYIDFRHSAKCQTANIILLVLAGLLTSITVVKFLAAIRFGSKPMPILQDRFVLCQVPVYTEGEDDVRLALDSLANLKYDNKKKLMVILCDGMITGAGNDRPTPQIILDLLGVDETRISPEPKAYHAIAEGAKELNYAKVYSGLYENEGNLVPFVCVVKVGVPNEHRPGNRGKRDSQLLLMNFLNRVHYGDPMCPLDLELFHHINNIIGIEPERFEFLLTIDADTTVKPDALNRMVAACTADNSISAVCGETGIENEKQSLSTMIQVYEYFISHHLTKAFESLFGSVTCLPGCFSLFRLRTVQRYKPLLISSEVIRGYSLRHVDTLHKKNLFSLGEDRYLTTLMSKNFSRMKMKFVADAKCLTRVPDDFSVLLSQRRRWINSTVHNLAELLRLNNMCGFFLFSMRGIVFTDLVGTLMLPSVVIYLGYLVYVLASKTEPLPLISIVLICSVYGLQALVFIMHQQWQHIFWMIVYIAAYPFHSFILPIYSFWNMDNFSWGNTRVVIDESIGKKVVLQDDGDVYDARKVPFETWHSYASRMGLPGRERPIVYDARKGKIEVNVFEDVNYEYDEDVDVRPKGMPFDAGTEAQIRDTIQQVLITSDIDTMTPRQLRAKVSDLLGTEFAGDRAAAVDAMIDEELLRDV